MIIRGGVIISVIAVQSIRRLVSTTTVIAVLDIVTRNVRTLPAMGTILRVSYTS